MTSRPKRLLSALFVASTFLLAHPAWSACDHLLFDNPGHAPYSGKVLKGLGRIALARYDVEFIGLDDVLARGRERILFVSNHQSIIDALLALASEGRNLNLRPLVAEHRLRGPLGAILRPILQDTRGYAIPSVFKRGRGAAVEAHEVMARMTADLRSGSNEWVYYNGYVQNTAEDSRRTGRLVAEVLRLDPDTRVVLVRQRGMWGSRFSFADLDGRGRVTTSHVVTRGLLGSLATLARTVGKPVRRRVTFTLEEVDLRALSRRAINQRIQAFYDAVPEQLTLVP